MWSTWGMFESVRTRVAAIDPVLLDAVLALALAVGAGLQLLAEQPGNVKT